MPELLDLARLQGGEALGFNREPTDLVARVRAAVVECQQTAKAYTIRLDCDCDALVANVDRARLQRAVSNVLSNAVKYSAAGSVVSVRLHAPTDVDPRIWLEVQDERIGIPAADLPFVFEPFHRGSNVGPGVAGTGLGLAGVRQIVAEHGGTVEVTSTEGWGTTFMSFCLLTSTRLYALKRHSRPMLLSGDRPVVVCSALGRSPAVGDLPS